MSATVRISRVDVGEFVSIPSVRAHGMVTGITCDSRRTRDLPGRWAVTVQAEPEGPETTYTLSGERIAIVEA